ncbi:MAG: RimK/LysX family protein [Nitrospinota bacterium]|jgi:hypothetical protein|nr:RimK/LysX family protein [Nitrospinota bacterium]MDH5789172.1 RimK/LysX family protein [Nitrospinota bacterium]
MKKKKKVLDTIGWREWVSFPELGIEKIKAKIDTGARTSALHVSHIRVVKGTDIVKFKIHPVQRRARPLVEASARIVSRREIKSSNGEISVRPVIITKVKIGEKILPIELSLVNRDLMGFRLLLGRSVLKNRFIVDSGKSFLLLKK